MLQCISICTPANNNFTIFQVCMHCNYGLLWTRKRNQPLYSKFMYKKLMLHVSHLCSFYLKSQLWNAIQFLVFYSKNIMRYYWIIEWCWNMMILSQNKRWRWGFYVEGEYIVVTCFSCKMLPCTNYTSLVISE